MLPGVWQEGLLDDAETAEMIEAVRSFGALLSMRAAPDGTERAYELNTTYFDALAGTTDGPDDLQIPRFLCSQTIVMALEGIPAFYVHALLATGNDEDGARKTGVPRAINRYRWHYPELQTALADPDSRHARVLAAIKARLAIRRRQKAFHPNATQFTLQLGSAIFGFWRQSLDRDQSVFALHNVSRHGIALPVASINLIGGEDWMDLLSGERVDDEAGTITFAPYQCRWITNRR